MAIKKKLFMLLIFSPPKDFKIKTQFENINLEFSTLLLDIKINYFYVICFSIPKVQIWPFGMSSSVCKNYAWWIILSFKKGLFFAVIGTLFANLSTPHIINPTKPKGIPNSNQLR